MTIDEAIKNREECLKYLEGIGKSACPECVEAVRWSVKALKYLKSANSYSPGHIDREAWEPCGYCNGAKYIYGHASAVVPNGYKRQIEKETEGDFDYCPKCGRPLTDEAWAELEKRLRW